MKVAIVLDPRYPDLEKLVADMAVWAVDSVAHRAIAERLWQLHGGSDALQGVTLFKVMDEGDKDGNCRSIIGDVDLHHGIYSSGSEIESLRIVGSPPSQETIAELESYGLSSIRLTTDGFVAARGQPAIQSIS